MVFNATFSNMSVISWRSILLVEETEGPGENHRTDQFVCKENEREKMMIIRLLHFYLC